MTRVVEPVAERATPAEPDARDDDRPSPSRVRSGGTAARARAGRHRHPRGSDVHVLRRGRGCRRGSIGGPRPRRHPVPRPWVFTVNGERLLALAVGHRRSLLGGVLPDEPARWSDCAPNAFGVRRLRFVGDGLHERIEVSSYIERAAPDRAATVGRQRFRRPVRGQGPSCATGPRRSCATTRRDGSALAFRYRNETFEAETRSSCRPPRPRGRGRARVGPRTAGARRVDAARSMSRSALGPREIQPLHRDFGEAFAPEGDDPVSRWLAQLPQFESRLATCRQVVGRTARDLLALRIAVKTGDEEIVLPAAGLPWFLTLFGRDTLLTRVPGGRVRPAARQRSVDRPGGVPGHEARRLPGRGAGQDPARAALRRADAARAEAAQPVLRHGRRDDPVADPAVRVLALDRRRRAGRLVARQRARGAATGSTSPATATATATWSTQTRSTQGLGNQCWRDSWDGVQFADGTHPVSADRHLRDPGLRLRREAAHGRAGRRPARRPGAGRPSAQDEADDLRERFERDFWIDARGGYYAIGLDGDKRPIDSLTSNIGQLLWTRHRADGARGDHRRPAHVRRAVLGLGRPDAVDRRPGFNPIGYHRGTVWPHDNSLIALGLARYGFRDEANRIAIALLDAATFSAHRLPEAFSGYDRSIGRFPVPYPTACSPQAWATGAPLAAHPRDARPGGARRRGRPRPARARRDRPRSRSGDCRRSAANGISRPSGRLATSGSRADKRALEAVASLVVGSTAG